MEDGRFIIKIEEARGRSKATVYFDTGDVKDFEAAVVEAAKFIIKRYGMDLSKILKTAEEGKP